MKTKVNDQVVTEFTDPTTGEQLDLENLIAAHIDSLGREVGNPVPIAPPLGYKKQPSLSDQIRDMVRSEHLRQAAENAGMETFDEAEDFDVGDDVDPDSPYELQELEGDSAQETQLLNQMVSYADQLGFQLVKKEQKTDQPSVAKGAPPPEAAKGDTGGSGGAAPLDKSGATK